MAETYDDRPDARVPADRPLSPQDLRQVRFSTAFRGYRMSEVDALLDRLAAELEPRCPRPHRRPRALRATTTGRGRLRCASDCSARSTSPPRRAWSGTTSPTGRGRASGSRRPASRISTHAAGLGGRFRALERDRVAVGFWDPMTITGWERTEDGGGRCEVLHLGAVVRGEGEFVVLARGEHDSRFVWAEMVVLPFGPLGALGWRLVRPVVERLIDRGLRTMRDRVERDLRGRSRPAG